MALYKKIYIEKKDNWFWVSDGKGILYFEKVKDFNRYEISSVHQPNTRTGTGFRLDDWGLLDEFTIQKYINNVAPPWAHVDELKVTKQYDSLDDFVNKSYWKDKLKIEDIIIN